VIDVNIGLRVGDARRSFSLVLDFRSEAKVLALFGPSGGGKSLTLQAVAGLLRPQSGHVRVAGRSLFDAVQGIELPPERRGLGLVFQQYALFPHLSVRDNIGFGLRRWGQRLSAAQRQRVDALIEAFGLDGLGDSRPATLSGGQQQRVALARALACEPQLLLLDEPFAALNAQLRRQLRAELASVLAAWKIPALLVSHDLDDVMALAQAVLPVADGRGGALLPLGSEAEREAARSLLEPPQGLASLPRWLPAT
jgi:molybdate transport system ATP-binding protein